jgi:hypothetical protein
MHGTALARASAWAAGLGIKFSLFCTRYPGNRFPKLLIEVGLADLCSDKEYGN